MLPCDCDACRFSIYIENETIYPCELIKSFGIKFNNEDENISLNNFWNNNDIRKFRAKIIENNYC